MHAQVGIGTPTPDPSAILELQSTSQGFLLPRMNATQMNAISSPVSGLMVFNTTAGEAYYYDGTNWNPVAATAAAGWNLTGNAGTSPATDYIGTSDAQPLVFRTNGNEQMRLDVNGNLGIGTNAPTELLMLLNPPVTATHAGLLIENDAAGFDPYLKLYSPTGGNDAAIFLDDSDGNALKIATDIVANDADRNANTRLVLTQSGNLGIGTTAPAHTLHVGGDLALNSGSSVTAIIDSTALSSLPNGNALQDTMLLSANAISRLLSDSLATVGSPWDQTNSPDIGYATGNVGIGTNAPTTDLTVLRDGGTPVIENLAYGADGGQLFLGRANGSVGAESPVGGGFQNIGQVTFGGWDGNAFVAGPSIGAFTTENWAPGANGAQLRFFTTPNGSATPEERMRIFANGNVGIGTNSPQASLHVLGPVDGSAGFAMHVQNQNSTPGFGWDGLLVELADNDAGDEILQLRSGNGNMWTIDAQGRVDHDGYQRLTYSGVPRTASVIENTSTGVSQHGQVVEVGRQFDDVFIADFRSGGTTRMSVRGGGSVGIGTTSPAALLDVNGDFRLQTGTAVSEIVDSTALSALPNGDALQDTMLLSANAISRLLSDSLNVASPWDQTNTPDIGYTAGRVGIGTISPANSTLTEIDNTGASYPRALVITNAYSGATYKYGMLMNVTGDGAGIREGIRLQVDDNATDNQTVYGHRLRMSNEGTGIKRGYTFEQSGTGTSGTLVGLQIQDEDYNTISGNLSVGSSIVPSATLDVNGNFRLQTGTSVNRILADGNGTYPVLNDDQLMTAAAIEDYVVNNAGGLTHFTEATATQGTNTMSIWSPSSGGDVGIVLQPLGNGFISANTPDGGTAGGNPRGEYAVDLQLRRFSSTEVASGNYAVISGGLINTASDFGATVGGGDSNIASGGTATVGGGRENTASGFRATVAGGYINTANGDYANIGGGQENTASGAYATVGGGIFNTASEDYASVGGGQLNTAEGQFSTIPGGFELRAQSYGEVALGTFNDTLTGGFDPNSFAPADRLLTIGNGDANANRSNALVMLKNGNTTLNGQLTLSDGANPFTLPNADGTNGQVLVTDGTGTVTWQAAPGGALWTDNSPDISYTTGNVGIGTNAPSQPLHVVTDALAVRLERLNNTPGGATGLTLDRAREFSGSPDPVQNDDVLSRLTFRGYDGTNYEPAAEITAEVDNFTGNDDIPGRLIFRTTPDGSNVLAERMRVDEFGRVGINQPNPGARLDVDGTIQSSGSLTGPYEGLSIRNNSTGIGASASQRIRTDGDGNAETLYQAGGDNWAIGIDNSEDRFGIAAGLGVGFGNDYFTILNSNGHTGINETSPAALLDVNGDFRLQTGSAVSHIVDSTALSSLPNGDALQDTMLLSANAISRLLSDSLAGSSLWTDNSPDISYTTGNVGIGTPSPGRTLDVNGSFRANNNFSGERALIMEAPSDPHIAGAGQTGLVYRVANNPNPGDPILQVRSSAQSVRFFVEHDGYTGAVDNSAWFGNNVLPNYFAGDVGIGTESPGARLHLRRATGDVALQLEADPGDANAGDNPEIQFIQDGGGVLASVGLNGSINLKYSGALPDAVFLKADLNEALQLVTNNEARLTVRNSGNVGIGTTDPTTPFALNARLGGTDVGITQGAYGGNNTMELTTEDGNGVQASRMVIRGGANEADIEFLRGASGSETSSVFIDGTNGFLGVRSVQPASRLEIRKNGGGGMNALNLYHDGYNSNQTTDITFQAGGLTSEYVDRREGVRLRHRLTNSADPEKNEFIITLNRNQSTTVPDMVDIMVFEAGPREVGINTNDPTADLSVNGNANKPGGGNWGTFSDKRLKKDVRPFAGGTADLMQIRPVWFRYNGKGGIANDSTAFVGVIAQELRKVAPYMVDTLQMRDTEDGPMKEYLGVNANAFTYMLINATQEQQRTIAAQQAELEALREQNQQQTAALQQLEERFTQLERQINPQQAESSPGAANAQASGIQPDTR